MKTYNNTAIENIEQILIAMNPVKRGRNNWRGRMIMLYEHPTDTTRIISSGVTFNGEMRVIADEPRSDWSRELGQSGDFVTD